MPATAKRAPSIVIVGGGSAGWITASVLHRMLCQGDRQAANITVVESARIGIIGVGEATIVGIKTLFKFLGLKEEELLRRTQATFKHGIHYRDWEHSPDVGKRSAYFHPFDPINVLNVSTTHWWLARRSEIPGANFVEDLVPQYRVAAAGKAPRRPDMPEYDGPVGFGYHLDAEALAELLAERAIAAGVARLIDDVIGTNRAADGFLSSIVTAQHGEINADFFVDCSGFTSLLLEKTLGTGFNSYGDSLFCDRAVAFRVPGDEASPIRPFTTAIAKSSGWIWEIDLQRRSGMGYVYSSGHTTAEQAEIELRRHIGPKAEKLDARHLKMRVGHAKSFWKKNVVAIGLSGGFIEPLESTGLYLIQEGAFQLAESLIPLLGLKGHSEDSASNELYRENLAQLSELFNRRMVCLYESLRDFIKIHYCISKRRDSTFWQDNVDPRSIPESLKELIARWKIRPPQQFDFPSRTPLFSEYNWQCIMLGLGWRPQDIKIFEQFTSPELGEHLLNRVRRKAAHAIADLPDHRAYFSTAAVPESIPVIQARAV